MKVRYRVQRTYVFEFDVPAGAKLDEYKEYAAIMASKDDCGDTNAIEACDLIDYDPLSDPSEVLLSAWEGGLTGETIFGAII